MATEARRSSTSASPRCWNLVSLTRTGTTIGSAGFKAPEQFSGQADPAADIFAWAVTLAYAASGQPFGTGPIAAVVYRILHDRRHRRPGRPRRGPPAVLTSPDGGATWHLASVHGSGGSPAP